MKPKYIYLILTLAITGFLAFNAFTSGQENAQKGTGNEKIIKFSHKLHAEVTDCQGCHSKAAESTEIGKDLYPNHENCGSCHDVEDTNNCKMCHFDENFEALHYRDSGLNFNHKFHISEQKLECLGCHKGINEVEYGYQANPLPYPPMSLCNTCHNNYKDVASNECSLCHKSTSDLRPASHQKGDFRKTHKFDALQADANCNMCHDNSSCEDCHIGNNILTENNTKNNFHAPYAPANSFEQKAQKQQITRVHDLNYVYNHGIDLKGGTMECQTCHQVETFCAECHQNAAQHDFSIPGVLPASHRQPNFITAAVGSGGGMHAVDAKRDIESCASCHDVQGGDPACIKCHMDPDGIKGNNPKTHPSNFMHDTHGDWHDSQGSLCFNCHTNATPDSPKGVGFCGYCHK